MKSILVFGLFACVNLVVCSETYKAGFVSSQADLKSYSSVVKEAAKSKLDILVLPPHGPLVDSKEYDEVTKTVSASAQQAGLYVVAHLLEKTRCHNKDETVRSSIVFDRKGVIVADYRKPMSNTANCTTTSGVPTFWTDFGVTFTLVVEEDLVLHSPGDLKTKNVLVTGGLSNELSLLKGNQFLTSFAYVTNANLVTSSGIFAGRSGYKSDDGKIAVAELKKTGGVDQPYLSVSPTKLPNLPSEDLSQYIIRPLNLEASPQGHTETVCHGKFCCQFYVKTSYPVLARNEVSYGLAVFEGSQHFARGSHIGTQSCSVVACAGLYKRTCSLGANNSTNTLFEKISISGNFAETNSAQYPLVLTTSENQQVNFTTKTVNTINKVTISIESGKNVINFGIFGREFSKDFDRVSQNGDYSDNFYDYIFNNDVQEFFDYLWIRLRIPIFIVSIYVLEML